MLNQVVFKMEKLGKELISHLAHMLAPMCGAPLGES